MVRESAITARLSNQSPAVVILIFPEPSYAPRFTSNAELVINGIAARRWSCCCSAIHGRLGGRRLPRAASDLTRSASLEEQAHHPVSPHHQPHNIHNGRLRTYNLLRYPQFEQCARCDGPQPRHRAPGPPSYFFRHGDNHLLTHPHSAAPPPRSTGPTWAPNSASVAPPPRPCRPSRSATTTRAARFRSCPSSRSRSTSSTLR